MKQAWAGVDIGKGHHHVVVIDSEGQRLLSRRVINDEAELLAVMGQVLELADAVTWAVDINTGGAALLLALLVAHGQRVLYISSTMVNRAADGYRGEGKTDARDAAVIADQARMRRGLAALRLDDELIVELKMLVSADHLAGYAGLAPAPRDSGRVSGNLHRPRRYNRALNRVFYTSALVSIQRNPESKRFYDRKRSEGKRHTQAVLALARRRVNVLWALIRDQRPYQLTPPIPA